MKILVQFASVGVIAAVLGACSMAQDAAQAEGAVQQFHQQLDAGQSAAIYAAAGDELKKVSSEQEFVPLLDAVHRKLGAFKSAAQNGWRVNYQTAGKFVTLDYKSTYAGGEASEEFVYRLAEHGPMLVGYHVNSNALILK